MDTNRAVEEKSRLRSKKLYKVTLVLLKVIPMLLAFCYVLNTTLYVLGIDSYVLSHVAGMSLLPMIFLYLTSYVFQFCAYHRMFLHYIVLNDIINILDAYFGKNISNWTYISIHLILLFICLGIVLYLYKRKI